MITAFCILAEPEKLQYPYLESIISVSHFCDKILINFASNTKNNEFRQFEKSSYDKICRLNESLKNCKIEIIKDDNWPQQNMLDYETLRKKFQNALDSCDKGWFLKFDADNVFRKDKANQIKNLFDTKNDKLIFRRISVSSINSAGINMSSSDIYALNINNLKLKKIRYKIGDIDNWCGIDITSPHTTAIISDENLIPVNYDATFFTKERIIDFWKKTEELYSFAQQRKNRFIEMTDEQILENYINYKKIKHSSLVILKNFKHPEDIKEKIDNLNLNHWGYNNFAD